MMTVSHSELVDAPLERVREAVLTPDAYRENTKVGQVEVLERLPDGLLARIHGHLGPVRSAIVARYRVHPGRVDLEMLAGRLRGFHASFDMEPEGSRVRLTHTENYDFGYGPFGPLLDRALRGWALGTVTAEVRSLKHWAEAGTAAG